MELKDNNYLIEGINIEPLIKARNFLDYALKNAKDDFDRAGCIQAFEFCYELTWKLMRKILISKGITKETLASNPKNTFRVAAENFLIDSPEPWFVFILKRNLTTHTYNLDTAREIFGILPDFLNQVNAFIKKIQHEG